MCDLIDLKSPEVKTVGPKLASPLIPAPSKLSGDDKNEPNASQTSSGLNYVKRNSLDNNPFDNALHKTAEYVRKQEDPFEVVLEKAMKYKERDIVVTPKARSVEFKDDFTPKKTRYSDVLKMNKTLDDSLMEAQLAAAASGVSRVMSSSPCPDDSIIHDLDNTNLLAGRCGADYEELEVSAKFVTKNGRLVPRLCVETLCADSSILNQSAMNDSLTDSGDSSEESLLKSIVAQRISMCIQKGTNDANKLTVEDCSKSNKLRRSLSQGDRMSPRKFRQHRSQSIADSLKVGMPDGGDASSISSYPSIFFEDSMNKAFLQTQCANDVSAVSNISNLSAIPRLGSVSSAYNSTNSSSAFSNRTINCAFIENSSGNASRGKFVNDKVDGQTTGMSKIRSTGSISAIIGSPIRDCRVKDDISDLLAKYSKLKVESSEPTGVNSTMSRLPSIISGSGIHSETVCERSNNKLIDVDVFVPDVEPSPPLEHSQRTSVSSTSSDSVFLDNNTVGRSILSEAKSLARTFEELAGKASSSSSSSNVDDLINSRPRWNFDVLPVSDDEAMVDNLIELPDSPVKKNSSKLQNSIERSITTTTTTPTNDPSPTSSLKSPKTMLKELETEFIEPEKKISASTLLMDLEKLVKSENNPKAIELLENLEKALGVKSTSNAELLTSCFIDKNDLTKSPKKSDNNLETENIPNDSKNEKSCEDNANVESFDSEKKLSQLEMSLQENLNCDKDINKSDKSLMMIDDKKFDDRSLEKIREMKICDSWSKDDDDDDSIEAIKQRNRMTNDQKMAVDILVGLGKLLSGDNKNSTTANVLKNLGMVLNLASSSSDVITRDEDRKIIVKENNRELTPIKKRLATPPRKPGSLSAFSRSSIGRRSLETSTKNKFAGERALRRSTSVTNTPINATTRILGTPLSADKTKSHLKETKKRFSSDPCFVNGTMEKKKEVPSGCNKKLMKDVAVKSSAVSELTRQDKPSSTVAETVKNKLRKKTDSDGSSKRGPMKAILPLGNMQRRGSIGKRISPLIGSITPPKQIREAPSAFTVTTSTPFPMVHLSCPKKSPKTKPMASSTPDAVGTLSCNISPVTSKTDEDSGANSSKDNSKSSKTINKTCTPSKSRSGSQLPKLSPMLGMRSSPNNNSSRVQRRSEPLQSFLPRTYNPSKSPSICVTEAASSPHNNSNKIGSKVKPLNLISKLRRRSSTVADKENYA